ncbi:MAG: UDP-glucose 6-dehydrogenase [Acidobacteria bacterium]|nr:MAG: UDP-glucose 6-dehydrogenase [Acidobacteriota bacterium]
MASKIGVVGCGYVGLVTGACFASLGHDVLCADIDADRIEKLSKGFIPIFEPGLEELVREGIASQRLRFTTSTRTAAEESEYIFICVQTPQLPDGNANMSFVEDAAREIAGGLSPRSIVINKSTMPVGSVERVRQVAEGAGAVEVHFVSNPEFLREGSAVYDFLHPDRIVIGSDDPVAAGRVSQLYTGLHAPILITDAASAEMIKYASNAFLAMKISFANGIANLCAAVGADAAEVTLGMGYDRRIGFEFLKPGPGFGGSCFPKDSSALLALAREQGVPFALLDATLEVNASQISRIVAMIEASLGELNGRRIGVLGLAFKANTDDVRDSPAIEICRRLLESGAEVVATDPAGSERAASLLPGLRLGPDPASTAEGADCLALLTEWEDFRWLDYEAIGATMARKIMIDARNLLDPAALRRAGFDYYGIGR